VGLLLEGSHFPRLLLMGEGRDEKGLIWLGDGGMICRWEATRAVMDGCTRRPDVLRYGKDAAWDMALCHWHLLGSGVLVVSWTVVDEG
jgi:hypothetical protein